jgi:hypothetical protein
VISDPDQSKIRFEMRITGRDQMQERGHCGPARRTRSEPRFRRTTPMLDPHVRMAGAGHRVHLPRRI